MHRKLGLLLSLAAITLSGCASIMNPGPDKVDFRSDPPGATINIDGVDVGQTPATIAVPRKISFVKMRLPGYDEITTPIKRTTNGWLFANFIFGGVVGIIIDVSAGNDKVADKEMTVTMEKAN